MLSSVLGSEVHAHEHETGDYFWSKEKVILTSMGDIQVTTFGWSLIAVHGNYDLQYFIIIFRMSTSYFNTKFLSFFGQFYSLIVLVNRF